MFGTYATTRSPGPIPDARRALQAKRRVSLVELPPRRLGERPQLGRVTDRDRLGLVVAEDVLGVVEPRAGEPLRAGHRRGARTRSYGADARTSKNSQIEPQKASSSVTDHRQRSW